MRALCVLLPLLVHALPADGDGDGWPDAEESAKGFDPRAAASHPPGPRYAVVDLGPVAAHGTPAALSATGHRVLTAGGRRWSWALGWEVLAAPGEGAVVHDCIRADGSVIGRAEVAENCDLAVELWCWDGSGVPRPVAGTRRSYVAIDDTAPFAWQYAPLRWLRGDDLLLAARPAPDQVMPVAADVLVASSGHAPAPVWRLADGPVVADGSGGRWVRPAPSEGESAAWRLEGDGRPAELGAEVEPLAFSDDGGLLTRARGRLYWHAELAAEPVLLEGAGARFALTVDDAGEPIAVSLGGVSRVWALGQPGACDRLADLVDVEEPWVGFEAVDADAHGTLLAVGTRILSGALRRDAAGAPIRTGLAPADLEPRVVLLVPCRVRVDHERRVDVSGLRGRFPMDDAGATPPARPLRLWLNDDHDAGDQSEDPRADLPGARLAEPPNYLRPSVGGAADLVDWFPVCLRLGAAAADLPDFHVWILADALPVNVVETSLPVARAAQYLQRDLGPRHGPALRQPLGEATKSLPGRGGVALSEAFSRQLVDDRLLGLGEVAFLLEGRLPGKSLAWVCLVRASVPDGGLPSDGDILLRAPLRLQVAPVEAFYRQWDARSAGLSPADEPLAWPDRLSPGPWLVFTHGFNVDVDAGRAWGAEIFKRFHQSGSAGRFVAFRWFGDQGAANYGMAVECAPAAADRLAEQVRRLERVSPGRPWVLLGHSLGCYVTALAGRERLAGAVDLRQLVLVDAALPAEALDPMASARPADYASGEGLPAGELLVPHAGLWRSTAPWSWPVARSAAWAGLFPPDDLRSTCAWKGRLAGAVPVLNVYSRTEDVLMPAPADPTRWPGLLDVSDHGAWLYQEAHKGRWPTAWLDARRAQAGWAPTLPSPRRARELLRAKPDRRALLLRTEPLFSDFRLNSALTSSPTGPRSQGSRAVARRIQGVGGWGATASIPPSLSWTVRDELLAHAIPALSNPAGAAPVASVLNYRMDGAEGIDPPCGELRPFPLGWPRGIEVAAHLPAPALVWRHSDWKNVAFPYVHPVFARIGQSAGLTRAGDTP